MKTNKPILITGGAGFIGTNLAKRILQDGEQLIILDNLSRNGTERNLRYLQERFGNSIETVIGDVRDKNIVNDVVSRCKAIFHFAAQVAVTTSISEPIKDFEINCIGTLNVLEAARLQTDPPPILYTSTNKVYGNLCDIKLTEKASRYVPDDDFIRGIDEKQPLDFHSPYGCSKGTADQYVRDYYRIYNVPTVVFRMSCIYGPHQCGNEDQGWIAHFLLQALRNSPITIYGDGKQVRDILYVDDLVDAMLKAYQNIDTLAGNVFNMGGTPTNAVSVLELIEQIANGTPLGINFCPWRKGDQLYYVSNTEKIKNATGWKPQTGYKQGIQNLHDWFVTSTSEGRASKILV